MPREYDDLYPSRDPAREECPDEECGGSLTSHWNGATEVVTCSRCGKAPDEGEGKGEGDEFNNADDVGNNEEK